MKNVKYLGFVGLGCATLLLTGCGGSSNSGNGSANNGGIVPVEKNILSCSKSIGSQSETVEFEYNDKEDKLVGMDMYASITIPSDATEDEIEEVMSDFNDECDDDRYKKCNVSRKKNKIEVKASFNPSNFNEDDLYSLSKEEMKKEFEDNGFTCK